MSLRRDESGQMILLGALLVLVTYFAVVAVTSRLDPVAARTATATQSALPEEVAALHAALERIGAAADAAVATPAGSDPSIWEGGVTYLPAYEAQRGYAMEFAAPPVCDALTDMMRVTFRLSDARGDATVAFERQGVAGACT